MNSVRTICIFCGSREGRNPAVIDAAKHIGRGLAARKLRLVYGAGRVGVMGALASATLQAGGEVIGVIPDHLVRNEGLQPGLTALQTVPTMHARKQRFFELSDAFVALPGGIGTLDEIFELIVWRQLKLHRKPILLLDINKFWKPLKDLIQHGIEAGFADAELTGLFHVVSSVNDLFAHFDTLAITPANVQSRNSKQMM